MKALQRHGISQRRSCVLSSIHRSTARYHHLQEDDAVLRAKIKDLAETHKRFGYRRIQVLLARERYLVNHKKIYRLYQEEGLQIRRRRRKKLIVQRNPAERAQELNDVWGMDFIFDATETGVSLKILVVLDEYSRYLIAAKVLRSFDGPALRRTLDDAIMMHGNPTSIKSDNGPEFTSRDTMVWCMRKEITQCLITPGKPVENSFVESLNGKLRDEFLNENLFLSVTDAQEKLDLWRTHYNYERPHSSLDNKTPAQLWSHIDTFPTLKVG